MRLFLSLVCCTCSIAFAAPVPVDKEAQRKELEAYWQNLTSPDVVVQTRAVFSLIDHPAATEFLAKKLPPVHASADQLKEWLKDLDSVEAATRDAAFAELQYHDPRIGLSLDDQLTCVLSDTGRRLLVSVWHGELIEPVGGAYDSKLTFGADGPFGRRVTFTILRMVNGQQGSSGWSFDIRPLEQANSPAWDRAELVAHALHRIDTNASRKILERLATGHKDAAPTRFVDELLKAQPGAPIPPAKAFTRAWDNALTRRAVSAVNAVYQLTTTPDAAKQLKAKLPAIKASKVQMTTWIKALESEDTKVWKPAFEHLLYFCPIITLSFSNQCDLVTTDRGRSALFWASYNYEEVPEEIRIEENCSLTPADDGLVMIQPFPGGGRTSSPARVGTLQTMTPPHWQRARIAIIALERLGTADAKEALKQLANGHPDILPTKEAKAALTRLGEKAK